MSQVSCPLDLSDAKALLTRARRHYDEYKKAVHGEGLSTLWEIKESFDRTSNEWTYRVIVNRARLIDAKPILSDAASNIISTLDHVVGAIARNNGQSRDTGLHFPRDLRDEQFATGLAKIEDKIGADMAGVLAVARRKFRLEANHVHAVRQIANSGKHWELMVCDAGVDAVILNEDGRQRVFETPRDADSYEFYRGPQRITNGMHLWVILKIEGLGQDLPNTPDSIFECAFRFVDGIMTALEHTAPS